MLKRNLLIGSLVAGAFVLPSLAQAGVVAGACVNCHTMHNSQNGANVGASAKPQLLLGDGCVGCHIGGTNDSGTGKDAGKFGAPQVGAASAPADVLSGGYFMASMPDNQVHNITGYDNLDAQLGIVPPGAGGTRATQLATDGEFTCSSCHNASGGHHGTSGFYRLLQNVTATGQADYGVQPYAVAAGVGDRSATQYDDTMNTFCASCHGVFHGANQTDTNGAFIRHPTDNVIGGNGASIPADILVTGFTDQTPVTATNQVMCLSCHVPHGGPRADLLSFTYNGSLNVAGGTDRSVGCETCHSYSDQGM